MENGKDHIKCNKCKYTGPVLHFAFIYGKTLCPKCATKTLEGIGRKFR